MPEFNVDRVWWCREQCQWLMISAVALHAFGRFTGFIVSEVVGEKKINESKIGTLQSLRVGRTLIETRGCLLMFSLFRCSKLLFIDWGFTVIFNLRLFNWHFGTFELFFHRLKMMWMWIKKNHNDGNWNVDEHFNHFQVSFAKWDKNQPESRLEID